MKLIIQIPCYNEEHTLASTIDELPDEIPGIDCIEWLVIDDGSTDRTVSVARTLGVHHIVQHNQNKGLAAAFQTGLNACLQLGADIIVNTDGDNQYPGRFIPELVHPILSGSADMVVGDRQTGSIEHFSPSKRVLQRLGSIVVRQVSGTDVPDAPSGFRALSREGAMRMNVMTGYTYTLETIIQAGKKNLKIVHIPIRTNPKMRESRLMQNTLQYVLRSAATIMRLYVFYEPFRTFAYLSVPFFGVGFILCLRYLIFLFLGMLVRGELIQSVIIGSTSLAIGFFIFLIGLIAEILGKHRQLQEETLYYFKRAAFSQNDQSWITYYKFQKKETPETE